MKKASRTTGTAASMTTSTRMERDTMGELPVPSNAYYGVQTARAIELGELPRFRRSNWYVAYGEGWALYAETLGLALGLYQDPASRFGHLQFQIWRAARLVVDTGLHDQGWSRERAIDYMVAQTGRDRGFMSSEVDRYTSDPAQALGYMIGQLKIIELRDRAHSALAQSGLVDTMWLGRLADKVVERDS